MAKCHNGDRVHLIISLFAHLCPLKTNCVTESVSLAGLMMVMKGRWPLQFNVMALTLIDWYDMSMPCLPTTVNLLTTHLETQ